MALDSLAVFNPLDRITDANGDPVSGGTIEFYAAGTSTPKTVYADADLTVSLGTTVATNSGGYPVTGGGSPTLIYVGTDDYKMIVKDASGSTLVTHDNIAGAPVIPTASSTALPSTPVVTRSSTYTILTTDHGKVINCSGASFAVTLPNASTAGDGWRVCVRHNDSAAGRAYTVRATGGQTVTFGGQAKTSLALTGYGESVWISCDGSGFHVDAHASPLMKDSLPYFRVSDRLTAPPSSPTGGSRYIINGSPTGVWSTLSFADKQVVESDGNGSWFAYTPGDGWLAYVEDENLLTQYRDSAWVDLSNAAAPAATTQPQIRFTHTQTDGTGGGTATSGSWGTVPINTKETVQNEPSGAAISTNDMVVPTGTWLAIARQPFYGTYVSRARLRNTGTSTAYYSDTVQAGILATGPLDVIGGATAIITAVVQVTNATDTFRLEYFVSATRNTSGLGIASTSTGVAETYAEVVWIKLDSNQGPRGDQGIQGADGLDAAYPYQWSTSTSGDPGSGKIAGNNATIASITQIAVSETDSAGGSMAAVIATWDDSTSSSRALVKISKEGATQNFHAFRITGGGTDQGAYWTFPVSYVATSGTISNSDNCSVLVIEKGDKGDTGSAGPTGPTGSTGAIGPNTGLDYAFSTATSGDPGSGKVLFNSATPGSVTSISISKTGRNSESLGTLIGAQDDSTNTAHKGHLRIFSVSDRTKFIEVEYSATFTDNSTYWTIPISSVSASGSLPANNDVLAVMFERTGDKGTDGSTGVDLSTLSVLPINQIVPTADKGFIYDASASTHKAFYIPVPSYSFTDPAFGGVGDDSTANDTAWSAFIDAGIADGKPLWVPAGIYRVTTAAKAVTVNSSKGFRLFGDGAASVIKRMNNLTSVLLDLQGNAPVVENIKFQYSNASTTANGDHMALRLTGCTGGRVDAVHVTGAWYAALESRNGTDDKITRCFIQGAINRGLYVQATTTARGVILSGNHVDGQGTTTYGVNFNRGAAASLLDCVVVGNKIFNVQTHGIGGCGANLVISSNLVNTVSNAGGVGILVEETNGTIPDRCVVSSNVIISAAIGVGMREDDNCKVNGNLIYANAASGSVVGILCQGTQESQVTDNIITTTANNAIGIQASRTTRSAVNYDANEVTIARNRIRQSGTGTVGIVTDANSSGCNVDRASNDVVGSATAFSISGGSHRQGLPQLGTYTVGDLFYASADGTLAALAAGALGRVLTANGTGTAPSWSDAPQITSINLGHATDTTLSRDSAGVVAVEGVPLYSQVPQNSQSAAYTLVLADAQKHIYHPSSDNNARTFTIPANSSVAYPIGTCLTFVNAINTVTIAITTDTMTLAGSGTTGSRTLAANGIATAMKITSTSWIISGSGLT